MARQPPVDRGWAWVILLAAFMDLVFAGIVYCNGIFNVVFLMEYHRSKALTAWCGAIHAGLFGMGGIVGSVISHRVGPRVTIQIGGAMVSLGFLGAHFAGTFFFVFLCYGIIAGMGFGVVYTPGLVTIGFYFNEYRNVAYGLATTGIGVGTMAFAPLTENLIHLHGWKGAMLILSAIFANYFVVGGLMRPPNIENITEKSRIRTSESQLKELDVRDSLPDTCETVTYKNEEKMQLSLNNVESLDDYKLHCNSDLKCTSVTKQPNNRKWYLEPRYIAYITSLWFLGIGLCCTYVHFPAYVISMGTSQELASTLISIMGAGNIIGRIGIGLISNKWPRHLIVIFILTCIVTGVVNILGPFICNSIIGQAIYSVIFGSFANCFLALFAPMCIHAVGLEHLNLACGIASFMNGVGYLIGPPITGWLFDVTGSYTYTLILSGVCYFAGGLSVFLVAVFQRCRK